MCGNTSGASLPLSVPAPPNSQAVISEAEGTDLGGDGIGAAVARLCYKNGCCAEAVV